MGGQGRRVEGKKVLVSEYPFPWDLFAGLVRDLPAGHRDLGRDAAAMVSRMRPPPAVLGMEHIPTRGGVAVVINHYQRRGLWIGWTGAVVTAAMATRRGAEPPIHWLVTGGLRLCQWRDQGPELPGARAIFGAVARAYGMAALPLTGDTERAGAVHRWITWGRHGHALGIFPEGLEGKSAGLGPPAPGFDTLVRLLVAAGISILPCGIFEEGRRLRVSFGCPLDVTSVESKGGRLVMEAIATLLPVSQRGPYDTARVPLGSRMP